VKTDPVSTSKEVQGVWQEMIELTVAVGPVLIHRKECMSSNTPDSFSLHLTADFRLTGV